MKKSIKISIALISLFFSVSSFAWNALGHMVVANIAYTNLTPAAKTTVDNLVATFSKEYPDVQTFSQLADWPDSLQDQKIDFYTHWHYINNAISTDGTPTQNLIDSDNAVWAITMLKPAVGNANANVYERARSLGFFAHIIGDLHQPLHTVDNFTKAHPNGDKGGNSFSLGYNGAFLNAHRLWDSGVGIFNDNDTSQTTINQMTQMLEAEYPQTMFGSRASDLSPVDWANEGIQNANNSVYDTPEGKMVSTTYVTTGQKLAGEEAALAGYRLANFLNELFK